MASRSRSCLRRLAGVRAPPDRHLEQRVEGSGVRVAEPEYRRIDPAGPDGRPIALWESGAILLYLADKTGQFISTEPGQRYETLAWVFFQMSAIGPMFGQLGFFLRFGGKDYEDKRPQQRFIDESTRLLGILDRRLEGRDWIVDDYSIADIATLGWVNALVEFYAAGDILGLSSFSNVRAWLGRGLARPAVQRGLHIPARPA